MAYARRLYYWITDYARRVWHWYFPPLVVSPREAMRDLLSKAKRTEEANGDR